MSNRFKSNLYTYTKIVYDRKDGLHYVSNENDYLFSDLRYKTKIKDEDLPEWYISGRYYKNHGFISAKGVKHLVYKPNYVFNHIHKDDSLYISYDKPIVEKESQYFGKEYDGYDYCIGGGDIVSFIEGVYKYSDYDVTDIVKELIKKSEWFMQTFPDDAEAVYGNSHIKYLKDLLDKITKENRG